MAPNSGKNKEETKKNRV